MKRLSFFLFLFLLTFSVFASFNWQEDYKEPYVVSIVPKEDTNEITVVINGVTGPKGADKILVELLDGTKVIEKKTLGRSKKEERKLTFSLDHSGDYIITLLATRKDEEKEYENNHSFSYILPLVPPSVNAFNEGNNTLTISFDTVKEAENYTIRIYDYITNEIVTEETTALNKLSFSSLQEDKSYLIEVSANRKGESVKSPLLKKTVRALRDREWNFTYFGQSTKESLNHYEILDSDNLKIKLYAGSRTEQGGKFTSLHDGLSFYYTKIDSKRENFVLSCKITVDWINPTPDGQEGFALIAMDSLGEDGVSNKNHYTNSVSLIATKLEETINGVKYSSKDTLGTRFVTNITQNALSSGDSTISEEAKTEYHAFSFDKDCLVKSGDEYYLTLKKDNTGYHCFYTVPEEKREWIINEEGEYVRKEYPSSFTLFGPEKLLELDKDYVYVGFAAARWCEITVSDISLTITNPEEDPPREEEKPTLIPLSTSIGSPSGFWSKSYPFSFTSNSDGSLSVKESGTDHYYIKNQEIKANEEYKESITLLSSSNDLFISFKPNESYRPNLKERIAQYNEEKGIYEESYKELSFYKNVQVREIKGENIYTSPKGFGFNEGTKDSPLNLESALLFAKPGQTILLEGGVYNIGKQLIIERGNDGEENRAKTLKSVDGERAILRFSKSADKGGLVIWGNYWNVENVDITNTPDGSKGLQVAGSFNTISFVNAYNCGDTGIQISGSSLNSPSLWPHDNTVQYCISHDNSDLAQNNADGFAAKLTVGENNLFSYCISYSNIDDGWDLYSKMETGPIGRVTIKNCIAYANGRLSNGEGSGDGNGFKLGGDGISVNHTIENSISFNNSTNGLTSNSNPSLTIINCTLYNNGNRNLTLYGKGNGERDYTVENLLSISGTLSDDIKEQTTLISPNNFFSNGNVGVNSEGERFGEDIFRSIDTTKINLSFENGKINTHGLLEQDTEYGAHL